MRWQLSTPSLTASYQSPVLNGNSRPIVLKNSSDLTAGHEKPLSRLFRMATIEQSSVGWTFDTSKNRRKLLLSSFFNTIGQKQPFP
jgi:hypothetical protein